jgi:hypothetical protein
MVTAKIETIGDKQHLVLTIPMQEPKLSETGKSYIIATGNFEKTNLQIEDKTVVFKGMAFISAK